MLARLTSHSRYARLREDGESMSGPNSSFHDSLLLQCRTAGDSTTRLRSSLFSPEFCFLLACCAWPHSDARANRLSNALRTDLDWNEVLRLAERHRVIGLVADAFQHLPGDAVPKLVRAEVTNDSGLLARQSLQLACESVRIARVLQDAGIAVAFLKGVPLAVSVYGDLGLRHSRDIDLLVSEEDAVLACGVMRSAGYRGATPAERTIANEEIQRWLRDNRDIHYVHEKTGVNVELHVRMFANPLLNEMFDSSCWHSVSMGGGDLVVLKPRELFLYLCLHGTLHGWFRLKWLADIAVLLAQTSEADRQQLLCTAESSNIAWLVSHAMQMSSLFFGIPQLEPSRVPNWREKLLTHIALQEIRCPAAPEGLSFRTTRLRLSPYLFRSDWRYLWLQTRCDFKSEDDRQLLRLPKGSSFLYPIVRPILWTFRRLLIRGGGLLRANDKPEVSLNREQK